MWNAFAKRGLGQGASSERRRSDFDPVPSFDSPFADEATVRFRPVDDGGRPRRRQLFVGRLRGAGDRRSPTPIRRRRCTDTFKLVPGTYELRGARQRARRTCGRR